MTFRPTRRDVLKTTAAVGAGYWLGSSPVDAADKSPNDKLNIACIGVGGRGRANVGGVARGNIVALCDVDDKRAGAAYKLFPKAEKFYDYRKLFDKLEGKLDAVVVSTPDHTHFHPSMMAMERGLHLYCEKPMAHSVEECRRMTEKAKEKKVATQLGMQRHAMSNMHRVVELIRAKAIGDVQEVHSWISSSRGMPSYPPKTTETPDHVKWDLWVGPAEMRPFSPDICPYKWRFWWDFGTGETGNWGCHILDIPFWALDLKYPTRVDASGPEIHPETTPKSMATKFKFPASDNRPGLDLHWYQASGGPDEVKKLGLGKQLRGMNTLFIGSEGMLLTGFSKHKLLPEDKFADFKAPEKSVPRSPGFHREWFIAAKGGKAATCDFDYSGPLAETVLLGNAAYRAGGGFDWDAENMKAIGNPKAEEFLTSEYRKGWEI